MPSVSHHSTQTFEKPPRLLSKLDVFFGESSACDTRQQAKITPTDPTAHLCLIQTCSSFSCGQCPIQTLFQGAQLCRAQSEFLRMSVSGPATVLFASVFEHPSQTTQAEGRYSDKHSAGLSSVEPSFGFIKTRSLGLQQILPLSRNILLSALLEPASGLVTALLSSLLSSPFLASPEDRSLGQQLSFSPYLV